MGTKNTKLQDSIPQREQGLSSKRSIKLSTECKSANRHKDHRILRCAKRALVLLLDTAKVVIYSLLYIYLLLDSENRHSKKIRGFRSVFRKIGLS